MIMKLIDDIGNGEEADILQDIYKVERMTSANKKHALQIYNEVVVVPENATSAADQSTQIYWWERELTFVMTDFRRVYNSEDLFCVSVIYYRLLSISSLFCSSFGP